MKQIAKNFGFLLVAVALLSSCSKNSGAPETSPQNAGFGLRDPQGCLLNSNWISPQELVGRNVVEVDFCLNGTCETRTLNRPYHPYAINKAIMGDLKTAGNLPSGQFDTIEISLEGGDIISEDFSEALVTPDPGMPSVCLQAKRSGNTYTLTVPNYKARAGFTVLDPVL